MAREEPYTDYYMWHDGTDGGASPPNNWVSIFRGPAWTFNETRGQWYLHQFDKGQPDLNYRNDAVKQEMMDVLTFWLEKGCDGYRKDAVVFLVEDENLADNPPAENPGTDDPNDPAYWNSIYTQSETILFSLSILWVH